MNRTQNWVEALNINPEKLSIWSAQVPLGTPMLVWCLENGHVALNEYLHWASQNFGLPILHSDFFTQIFTERPPAASADQWNSWCFPVETWDDVTLVACVEPPKIAHEGHFAYVLADPRVMREAWERKDSVAPTPLVEESLLIDAPTGIDLNATRVFQLDLNHINLPGHDQAQPVAKPTPVIDGPPPLAPRKTKPAVPAAKPTVQVVAPATGNEVEEAFSQLKEFYSSAMILKCKGHEAVPFEWSADLHLGSAEQTPVELNSPSLFRIVSKTLLPYHGYVVDSPAHREFFKRMQMDQLPACVTAIPLLFGENLWGILVASGDTKAQSQPALERCQRVAEHLVETMRTPWTKAG